MQPKIKYFNEQGVVIDQEHVGPLLAQGEKIGVEILLAPMTLDELLEFQRNYLRGTGLNLNEGITRVN